MVAPSKGTIELNREINVGGDKILIVNDDETRRSRSVVHCLLSNSNDEDDEPTNNKADEKRIPLTSIIECSVECYYLFEGCVVIASVAVGNPPTVATIQPSPSPARMDRWFGVCRRYNVSRQNGK